MFELGDERFILWRISNQISMKRKSQKQALSPCSDPKFDTKQNKDERPVLY